MLAFIYNFDKIRLYINDNISLEKKKFKKKETSYLQEKKIIYQERLLVYKKNISFRLGLSKFN